MKKIYFSFILLFCSYFSFSQDARYMDYYDTQSMYLSIYKVYYEFKDTELDVDLLKNYIKQVNFEEVFQHTSIEEDIELYIPNIQKTLVLYSKNKALFLRDKKYNLN